MSEEMTDHKLFKLLAVGMMTGTPILYLVAVGMALIAGVGVGNAFAIGGIPAVFGGITFGGFAGMMRYLLNEDKAEAAAKLERRASANAAAASATASAA